MKRILQLVLCALVFTVSAQAANEFGGVRGTVRDASNGETLPNANVVIDSLQMGMATDKVGYFVIKNLSPGLPTISASYVGYESRSIVANVKLGETARLVIELEQAALMGEEIEAVGERVAPTELTPVSAFGTRVTELARIPTVGQPDLMRGIQLLPGVQAASENSAGLYVRGGTPGQNLILLDDVVVYNPNHLFGFFSTFNPDALKDVTLIKGTFPARYGDRLSSVLDITNLDGNRKSFDARASMDLISAGLTVGGPVGDRGSWMFSGRRTYQELLNSPLFDHLVDEMFSTRIGTISAGPGAGGGPFGGNGRGSGFGGRTGGSRFGNAQFNFDQQTSSFGQDYGFYDTNFKLNLDVSDNDRVSVSGYMGNDALNLSLPSFRQETRDQLMDWGNQIAQFKWLHLYTDNLMGNVQVTPPNTTTPALPDVTPPQVTGPPVVLQVTNSRAQIVWETNEPADGFVEVDTLVDLSTGWRVGSTSPSRVHNVTVTNLQADVIHYYRVSSQDVSGNGPTLRPDDRTLSFRTLATPDVVPPVVIWGPSAVAPGETNVQIQWATDEPSDGKVQGSGHTPDV